MGDTEVTVGALAFIYLHAEDRKLVEQTIQCAKGAEETAEQTENKDGTDHDGDHQDELPGEQVLQHGEENALVGFVGQKQQTAFNGASGADVLTEGGHGGRAQGVSDGNDAYEEHQNCILEERKDAGNGAFLDFGRLDLVEQLLDQTKGTQPAADHSAEQNGVQ